MAARPWSVTADGLVLAVRVTPKGGRDAIEGVDVLADGRSVLKARVRASASEGEANAALLTLIARMLGIPRRDIVVIAGARGRIKRLLIRGVAPVLAATLEKVATIG